LQILWQRGLGGLALPRDALGVEERAPGPEGARAPGGLVAAAVEGVADDREAEVGEVDADLVRAPGLGLGLDEGVPGEAGAHPEDGHRRGAAGDDRAGLAAGAEEPDRRVDAALVPVGDALHEGDVAAADRVC
jgi:hypothetical protein